MENKKEISLQDLNKVVGGNAANGSHVVIDKDRCALCGSCVDSCPVEAIVLKEEGFEAFYFVKPELCNGCNICIGECPIEAISPVA